MPDGRLMEHIDGIAASTACRAVDVQGRRGERRIGPVPGNEAHRAKDVGHGCDVGYGPPVLALANRNGVHAACALNGQHAAM